MKRASRREIAMLANLDNAGQAETHRESWWHMMSITDRERAVGVAGLTREKAHMPLAAFSNVERERIRLALQAHIARMESIVQCMAAHNTNVHGLLH